MVDSSQLMFQPTSKSRDIKTSPNIKKIRPYQIYICAPAPTVNGAGDSFRKWPDCKLSRACDLDLGFGHEAHHRASLIDIYLHAKFHWNWRNFLWTEGWTYVRMDGHLRPALLGRLCWRVDLKKLKPGLVASYDIQPSNKVRLFW